MLAREQSNFAPSRRGLTGLLAAGAVMALPALPAVAASAPSQPAIAELWRQAHVARAIMNSATEDYAAAEERLPWWVKEGPSCVNSHGEFCGRNSWEPAIQDYTLPEEGSSLRRQIRIDESEIRKLFGHEAALWGEDRMRPRFEERMAKLNQRREAAQEERRRVGLPELSERSEAAGDASYECDQAIRELEVKSFDVLAAQIMIEAYYACAIGERPDDQEGLGIAALALKGLLPHLTGEIAVDAAEIVANPDRPLKDMRFARGIGGANA